MRDRWLNRLFRLMDSPIGAVLGGICYGLWALWVNWDVGPAHAGGIAFAHGLMSTLLTLFCVALMRRLFAIPRDPRFGAFCAWFGSIAATYVLLFSVHWLIGTPNILLTLAPGVIPTLGFETSYSLLLLRESRLRAVPVPVAGRIDPGGPHAGA